MKKDVCLSQEHPIKQITVTNTEMNRTSKDKKINKPNRNQTIQYLKFWRRLSTFCEYVRCPSVVEAGERLLLSSRIDTIINYK